MNGEDDNNTGKNGSENEKSSQQEISKSDEGLFTFKLNIINATGIGEVAGELWTIAKSLREGTIKQAYGNTKTPCRVEWEVRQEAHAEITTIKATAKVSPDGQKVVEAEIVEKKVGERKKEKEDKVYDGPTSEVSQIKGGKSSNQSS